MANSTADSQIERDLSDLRRQVADLAEAQLRIDETNRTILQRLADVDPPVPGRISQGPTGV